MDYILENQFITVETKSCGAELKSIRSKVDNLEYLWQAKPEYWSRHAPLLFPIVGKLNGNSYKVAGKEYSMSQHGFARDMEFEVVEKTNEKIVYRLCSDAETIEKYPFKFILEISYTIKEKSVAVGYRVINQDENMIYFSIGAHPGFNCPLTDGEKLEDYVFGFEKEESLNRSFLEDGLISENTEDFLKNEKTVPLSLELFERDAIIVKGFKSKSISLKSTKTRKGVNLEFEGFPYLGLWSKPGGAPFVCIEPWYGIADIKGWNGDLSEKEGVLSLQPDREFRSQYTISIE